MSRIIIYPYKMGSNSARELRDKLREDGKDCLLVYPNRKYRPKDSDIIVNWGSSTLPVWDTTRMINHPAKVAQAANKLKTYQIVNRVCDVPPWTTMKEEAKAWLRGGRRDVHVFARTILNGRSGNGIIVLNKSDADNVPDAPVYTYGIKKDREYRVHVFKGEVIDIQEKRKRAGTGTSERGHIWNTENGFVFCRRDLEVHSRVKACATASVKELGLDFGAVDIGWVDNTGDTFVFEVNTAPGLTGTTLDIYAEQISNL